MAEVARGRSSRHYGPEKPSGDTRGSIPSKHIMPMLSLACGQSKPSGARARRFRRLRQCPPRLRRSLDDGGGETFVFVLTAHPFSTAMTFGHADRVDPQFACNTLAFDNATQLQKLGRRDEYTGQKDLRRRARRRVRLLTGSNPSNVVNTAED
jgi:hypothetical protein